MKLFKVGKSFPGGFYHWLVWAEDTSQAKQAVIDKVRFSGWVRPFEVLEFWEGLVVHEVEPTPGVMYQYTERNVSRETSKQRGEDCSEEGSHSQ